MPLLVLGGVLIAIGIAYFVVSYGLLKGRGWAWSVTLILSYIGIAIGIVSIIGGNFISIVQVIINIVVIWYLYRQEVKAYFGKSPTAKI